MQSEEKIKTLESICATLRKNILDTVINAKSGHVGGPMSSVELMASLYFSGLLKMDYNNPNNRNRDKVLVRGHLGPLRYSIFSLLGFVDRNELATYRKLGSRLQGHEDMDLVPAVDITPSGSLGMLLSYGVGSALSDNNNGKPYRTWVFLGDGEEQEGSVSEAARHASHLHLDNLTCVMDKNDKQLSVPTKETDSESYVPGIWKNYGWDVLEVENGHSIPHILESYETVISRQNTGRPTIIVAHTEKGRGLVGAESHISGFHKFSEIGSYLYENRDKLLRDYNAKSLSDDDIDMYIKNLKSSTNQQLNCVECNANTAIEIKLPEEITQRPFVNMDFFISAMADEAIKQNRQVYHINADVIPPSAAQERKRLIKGHKINVGIREQHSLGMAHGISITDPSAIVLIYTLDSFAYRSADQLYNIAQGRSNVIILGTEPGLCSAFDGSTHQSTGQPGAILTIPGINLFEPADTLDVYRCMNKALKGGPSYIRIHNQSMPLLPRTIDRFEYQIIGYECNPSMTVISSGLETGEAFKAKQELNNQNIDFRLINIVDLKSIEGVEQHILEDKPCLTFYNGNPYVLKSAVATQVMQTTRPRPSYVIGYGFEKGTSGSFPELLHHYQLDKDGIKTRISNALKYVTRP